MFLAMHGHDSDLEAFRFYLAEKLGKTIGEIGQMPYPEYIAWASYYKVKAALREVGRGEPGGR